MNIIANIIVKHFDGSHKKGTTEINNVKRVEDMSGGETEISRHAHNVLDVS